MTTPIAEAPAVTHSVGFRLSRAARALRAQWRDELADLDVAPPEAAILRLVAASPGAALRELARTLGSDPMSTKRCVDALEARGLLVSDRRGEGRSRGLHATVAGARLVAEIERRAHAREEWLAASLGARAADELRRALDLLEQSLTPSPRS